MKTVTTKNINIFSQYFYPVSTGMEINMFETYSQFNKHWNIFIHTTCNTHIKKNILPKSEIIKRLKVRRYSNFVYKFFPWKMKCKVENSGLICLHGADLFPHYYFYILTLIKKILGIKKYGLVYTPHGLFNLDKSGTKSIKVILKTIIDHSVGVFLINLSVDRIRVISTWEKNLLVSTGIKSTLIELIQNGIEAVAYENIDRKASKSIKKKVSQVGNYIIQLARIEDMKNQEAVVKALALVKEDLKLILVGEIHSKKYFNKLIKLISNLSLTQRVYFFGEIGGIDKYYVVKHAKAMVHLPKIEGFGNAVHEAMTQGIPCIVSSKTALSELIKNEENGFVTNSKNIKRTAKLIEKICFHISKKYLGKIREKNIDFTQNHTWINTANKLQYLYSDIYSKIK